MRSYSKRIVILLVAAGVLIAGVMGCSDRPTDSTPVTQAHLKLDLGVPLYSAQQAINQVLATVVEVRTDSVLAQVPLLPVGPFVEATIDSLPADVELLFLIQAFQFDTITQTDIVIYEGRSVVRLRADDITPVLVNLSPVVPMIKLTPRQTSVALGQSVTLTAKLFNVPNTYGVSFRLFYNAAVLTPDTAVAAAAVNDANILFFYAVEQTPTGAPYVAISVTETRPGISLVDAAGGVALAEVRFSYLEPSIDTVTVVSPTPTGFTLTDSSAFNLADVYTDDSYVLLVTTPQM